MLDCSIHRIFNLMTNVQTFSFCFINFTYNQKNIKLNPMYFNKEYCRQVQSSRKFFLASVSTKIRMARVRQDSGASLPRTLANHSTKPEEVRELLKWRRGKYMRLHAAWRRTGNCTGRRARQPMKSWWPEYPQCWWCEGKSTGDLAAGVNAQQKQGTETYSVSLGETDCSNLCCYMQLLVLW